MDRWFKSGGAALLPALAIWLAIPAYTWLAADAVIERRYSLPRSLVQADRSPEAIARGARLVVLTGCTGCHGKDLAGKSLADPGFTIAASNLRALTKTYADEDFDRAIRRGLRPDASSLWVMPSQSYVYMHDSDVAAILGYLRALGPKGSISPPPDFPFAARKRIASGELQPVAPLAMTQMPALSLGPHYDGGRYLAMIACGSCHGGDLTGSEIASDLNIVRRYTRTQFFQLMRRGWSNDGRRLKTMPPLARARFHRLADWQIDALYAYLMAGRVQR
jgi:mono/diheme cytochrome c family protein